MNKNDDDFIDTSNNNNKCISSLSGPNMIYKIYNQSNNTRHQREKSQDINTIHPLSNEKRENSNKKINTENNKSNKESIDDMIANINKLMKDIDLNK